MAKTHFAHRETWLWKTHTICAVAKESVANAMNVLVVRPTGFLASIFRRQLPKDVTCDTINSAFHVPVNENEQPSANRAIPRFHIVIIDEISMVPDALFRHILHTFERLTFRPVLVVCEDCGQQQPFQKKHRGTVTLKSVLHDRQFLASTYHFMLYG